MIINNKSPTDFHYSSLIPGTQKIWMKTWGCSHNNSDGEYMAGQLAASGYKITGKNTFVFVLVISGLRGMKNKRTFIRTVVRLMQWLILDTGGSITALVS